MSNPTPPVFGTYASVMGYPAFQVQLNPVGGGAGFCFYVASPTGGLDINGNGAGDALANAATEASFLSAVKTWVNGYDWASDPNVNAAVSSVTITKIDQSQTDVTPS